MNTMETHAIDANGKRLGRVAAEAASVLRGKNRASYRRDRLPEVRVRIENAGALAIDPRKLTGKRYTRYTGYPGGLRQESLGSLIGRRGAAEALRNAIYGMLPRNKSRALLMKRITITA